MLEKRICRDAHVLQRLSVKHPMSAFQPDCASHQVQQFTLLSSQVVEFGKLSFADQIRTVHDAAVLAGISGSDLINAIFLPRQGVLVEMNPLNRGAQVPSPGFLRVCKLLVDTTSQWLCPWARDPRCLPVFVTDRAAQAHAELCWCCQAQLVPGVHGWAYLWELPVLCGVLGSM